MFFPDDAQKVNRFKQVAIPTNAQFFARYGLSASPLSEYSGDEIAPTPRTKVDIYADMQAYDAMKQREEASETSKS